MTAPRGCRPGLPPGEGGPSVLGFVWPWLLIVLVLLATWAGGA